MWGAQSEENGWTLVQRGKSKEKLPFDIAALEKLPKESEEGNVEYKARPPRSMFGHRIVIFAIAVICFCCRCSSSC
jgi:hypothetical protein